jgi:hypothetical protein
MLRLNLRLKLHLDKALINNKNMSVNKERRILKNLKTKNKIINKEIR